MKNYQTHTQEAFHKVVQILWRLFGCQHLSLSEIRFQIDNWFLKFWLFSLVFRFLPKTKIHVCLLPLSQIADFNLNTWLERTEWTGISVHLRIKYKSPYHTRTVHFSIQFTENVAWSHFCVYFGIISLCQNTTTKKLHVNSIGFRRWWITLRITRFLNSFHHSVF
jgi:hypothetical protein